VAHGRRALRRICCTGALALAAATLVPAVAEASEQVSSNWAGQLVTARQGRGRFTTVSGTWVVPTATCTAGDRAYSAVWVGLGGYREDSEGLEQLGTEQDCAADGGAGYSAWFELLPAAPVSIRGMNVHPGDTVSASATVAGHSVTFRLRDLTTGARYATTRHAPTIDVSSAEWIVEAPSSCSSQGRCTTLPLAKIGTVTFASATATSGKLARPAGDTAFTDTALKLEQDSVTFSGRPSNAEAEAATGPTRTLLTESPTAPVAPLGAFSVSLTEQTTQLPAPSIPTLPGFARR